MIDGKLAEPFAGFRRDCFWAAREVLLGSATGKCYWAALLDPLGLAPIRMFFGSGRAAERKPS
jgi:hypothetical protein